VYLLDVNVDMSSSGILGVYETVLVILQPNQPPLPPTTVINEVSIIIEDGPPLTPINDTTPSPEPISCPPETQENGVCPLTDDITPVPEPPTPCPPDAPESEVCPPTDEPTPIPGPPPECPEAGPEVCGDEPPPDGDPDSGDATDGNGNVNGNGEDGSTGNGENGDGDDNEGSEEIPTVPLG
jgi:hypothetical protein